MKQMQVKNQRLNLNKITKISHFLMIKVIYPSHFIILYDKKHPIVVLSQYFRRQYA